MSSAHTNPSGFPENLPQEQRVEELLKEIIRTTSTSFGYTPLETSAVEYLDTLSSKGEITKEIYSIGRALGEGEGESVESNRGLRFDLTVPFARYVAQHYNDLSFPFRRYQIQRVWRGERPQKGRFREFYQADIDVVDNGTLSEYFDAEVAIVISKILKQFPIGSFTISINNRKFLAGILESEGINDIEKVFQVIDKIDKVGVSKTIESLVDITSKDAATIEKIVTLLSKKVHSSEVKEYLESLAYTGENFEQGKEELLTLFNVLNNQAALQECTFVLNPTIVRGLDYYTGTVYETTLDGLEKYGSICSGGRYANLVSNFSNRKLPGVGMSIGLTRILAICKEENLLDFSQGNKNTAMLFVINPENADTIFSIADSLRAIGMEVEGGYDAKFELSKQLKVAQSKNVGYMILNEKDDSYTLIAIESDTKQKFSTLQETIDWLTLNKD